MQCDYKTIILKNQNIRDMTQQEFEQRTGFITTPELYAEIETEYMESELDKDKFCKVWVKQGGIEEMSNRMRGQILTLRRELAEERRKRDAEREHADKELREALIGRRAYCDELMRIFNIKDNHTAIHELTSRLISEYKKSHGYGAAN